MKIKAQGQFRRAALTPQHMSVHADVVGGWDDVEVGYLLGRGSSGSVYRAKCKDQHVAVKVWSAIPAISLNLL